LRPFSGISAKGEDCQPEDGGGGRDDYGKEEAFHGSAEAEPGCEEGHELGVSEADAFAAADEPVAKAEDEDEAGGDEDGDQGMPGGVEEIDRLKDDVTGPGLKEGEEEAGGDAGEGEPVGEPEVLGIEGGEGHQQPDEQRVAGELDQALGGRMRDVEVGGVGGAGCEEGLAEANPAAGPEQADG
jgi:hypothetical protein